MNKKIDLVGEQLKANRRMKKWADNPDGKAHRLIRAFVHAENKSGVASISTMKLLCSDPKEHPEMYIANFAQWMPDLCTEAGDSSGKVFEKVDLDHVRIWEPVLPMFKTCKAQFQQ